MSSRVKSSHRQRIVFLSSILIPPYFDCPNVHGKFLRNRQTDNVGFIFSAALDELYDREPAESFAGAVQTAGKLSFLGSGRNSNGSFTRAFGRAVCFINDENGKTRTLAYRHWQPLQTSKSILGVSLISGSMWIAFLHGLCTGIAGDFLKTLCDGNGALKTCLSA